MLSTKTNSGKPTVVIHPELGKIPALVILDCVFALSSDGEILHRHAEEFAIDDSGAAILLSNNGTPPEESRSRCQIIPPRIPEFPKLG